MAKYVEVVCTHCGKEFLKAKHHYDFAIRNGKNVFCCSKKCQVDYRRRPVKKICKYCGKEFIVPASREDKASFCSLSCTGKYHALKNGYSLKEKRICKFCGKEFFIKPSESRKDRGSYCTRACYYESKKENNKIKFVEDYAQIIVNSPKYGVHTVLVDKESLEKIGDYVVGIEKHHTGSFYARIYNRKNKKTQPLHRFLTNCPEGLVVDHLNHCTLDNRMQNLKVCTSRENSLNHLSDDILGIVKEYYRLKYYYKDFESA
jgi:hypothetical protein